MVGKTKPPTAAQRRRMAALKEFGCILCLEIGIGRVPPEIHHITECGRRLGHDHTIPICCWHHRGQPWNCDQRPSGMEELAGPSLARNKREFVRRFGTERDILERVDEQLKRMEAI